MINLLYKAKPEPFNNLLIAAEHNVTMEVEPSLLQEGEEEGVAHMEYLTWDTCVHQPSQQSSTVVAGCGTAELGSQEEGHSATSVIFGYVGHV
jgi:hypothetical protein